MTKVYREEIMAGLYIINHFRVTPPTKLNYLESIHNRLVPANKISLKILKAIYKHIILTKGNTITKDKILEIIKTYCSNDFTIDAQFNIMTKHLLSCRESIYFQFSDDKVSYEMIKTFFNGNFLNLFVYIDIDYNKNTVKEFLEQFDSMTTKTILTPVVRGLQKSFEEEKIIVPKLMEPPVPVVTQTKKEKPKVTLENLDKALEEKKQEDSLIESPNKSKGGKDMSSNVPYISRYPKDLLYLIDPAVKRNKTTKVPGIDILDTTALELDENIRKLDKRSIEYKHFFNFLVREAYLDAAILRVFLPVYKTHGVSNMKEFTFLNSEGSDDLSNISEGDEFKTVIHTDEGVKEFVCTYSKTPHVFELKPVIEYPMFAKVPGNKPIDIEMNPKDRENVYKAAAAIGEQIKNNPGKLTDTADSEIKSVVSSSKQEIERSLYTISPDKKLSSGNFGLPTVFDEETLRSGLQKRLIKELYLIGVFDVSRTDSYPVDLTKCATLLIFHLCRDLTEVSIMYLCGKLKVRDYDLIGVITKLLKYGFIKADGNIPTDPYKIFKLKLNTEYRLL